MAKRIVALSDGTWKSADSEHPTNVAKLRNALLDNGATQVVSYDEGVGTGGAFRRAVGGAFGVGVERNIRDVYRSVARQYEDGDSILLLGFSRGAYTVRSTVGLIRNSGLLRPEHLDEQLDRAFKIYRSKHGPDHEEAQDFRRRYSREVRIAFVGVWDTVGSLGIPISWLSWTTSWRHDFHDTELSGIVDHAYHAVAIDERRRAFRPSLWDDIDKPNQHVEQRWFVGVHSDVGGGYSDTGLSDIAFEWMVDRAASHGLQVDRTKLGVSPNWCGTLHRSRRGFYRLMLKHDRRIPTTKDNVHNTVELRLAEPQLQYRPENLVRRLAVG